MAKKGRGYGQWSTGLRWLRRKRRRRSADEFQHDGADDSGREGVDHRKRRHLADLAIDRWPNCRALFPPRIKPDLFIRSCA